MPPWFNRTPVSLWEDKQIEDWSIKTGGRLALNEEKEEKKQGKQSWRLFLSCFIFVFCTRAKKHAWENQCFHLGYFILCTIHNSCLLFLFKILPLLAPQLSFAWVSFPFFSHFIISCCMEAFLYKCGLHLFNVQSIFYHTLKSVYQMMLK